MKSVFPAHIVYDNAEKILQPVEVHLRNTAEYAAEKLSEIGLRNAAYLTGLLHDMGKFTVKFMTYIEAAALGKSVRRGSVCHTFCGCVWLLDNYHNGGAADKLTSEILAYAVGAHHGEFDCVDTDGMSGFLKRVTADKTELCYDEAVENFFDNCAERTEIDKLFAAAREEISALLTKLKGAYKRDGVYFLLGLASRMLLSAVIDADRRDTAEFMTGKTLETPIADKDFFDKQLNFYSEKCRGFNRDSEINSARGFFSDSCFEAAKNQSGIYKLTLPTGAGKTLAALRYALKHASARGKKRVIFVIPLLSILDQNSKVIRDYLSPDCIITEHHSDFVRPEDNDELDSYELLTETWESPVIITTLFQLLNTLFSDNTSSVRRFSALADSVVVIDEIQSLPIKTADMFCMAANYLAEYCGADIVLSSATQPKLEALGGRGLKYSDNAEIVPYNSQYFNIFKRSELIDKTTPYGMSIDELADFSLEITEDADSLLIICNTKGSAAKLYDSICPRAGGQVFFLSAGMCMAHRKRVLGLVRAALEEVRSGNGERVICVATQLVEAGVDFSFESVIRVAAGIDNAAQAAGRCNRSCEYDKLCRTYIVNLRQDGENLKMLRDISAAQRSTMDLLARFKSCPNDFDGDILSGKAIDAYYERFYSDSDIKGQFSYPCKTKSGGNESIFSLLSFNENHLARCNAKGRYILNQAFKTAGTLFKVFEDNTTDVIVDYNAEAHEIIAELNSEKAQNDISYARQAVEKAKPYIIRIYEYQRQKLADDGMLYFAAGDRILCLNKLRYDDKKGFCLAGTDIF